MRDGCEHTPGVCEAGGFAYMKQHGAWYDRDAKPRYLRHAQKVDVAGATLDEATGVYYRKNEGDVDYSSLGRAAAAAQHVAQRCGDGEARLGFLPDKHLWKTGLFEIKSASLEKKGYPGLPCWMPIPTHEQMNPDELILTTFKVNVQTHSRTQNCKWLREIYHDNPATAAKLGIRQGGTIRVRSRVGEIVTKARVTDGVVPGAIAISHHCGH